MPVAASVALRIYYLTGIIDGLWIRVPGVRIPRDSRHFRDGDAPRGRKSRSSSSSSAAANRRCVKVTRSPRPGTREAGDGCELTRGNHAGEIQEQLSLRHAQMPDYPYSRDGEAGVFRGGRERRGARGSGPSQLESASSGN